MTRNYASVARQYARAVVAGKMPTCKWVLAACQRQLDDLTRFKGKDSPHRFNPKLTDKLGRSFYPADNLCAFIERLSITQRLAFSLGVCATSNKIIATIHFNRCRNGLRTLFVSLRTRNGDLAHQIRFCHSGLLKITHVLPNSNESDARESD